MRQAALLLCFAASLMGCHPGPVIDLGEKQPPVGGTIAGIVATVDSTIRVIGRTVTAVDAANGMTYHTTTAANGGYTLKVPKGTYHIDIELHPGELLQKRPDDTHIDNGDLDPHRDFVIGVNSAG